MKTLNNTVRRLAFWVSAGLALAAASRTPAYDIIKDQSNVYVVTLDPGAFPLRVMLPASPALSDGTSQSSSFVEAVNAWNSLLGTVQFQTTVLSPGTYQNGNDLNEIVMDNDIDGDAFDENTLAVTMSYHAGNSRVESDIVFNTAYTWESFRGGRLATNTSAHDIRRVAIHELGHVLGLDHPDQASPPQSVNAIMNSRVSYSPAVDTMRSDDIAGAQSLYGAPGFVPSNNNFASAHLISLSNGSAQFTGTNVAATAEPGEPALDSSEPGRRTIWWKWTAPTTGEVIASTLGSNFDTLLGAYTGSAVNALTRIALNDDEELPVQGVDNPNRKRTSRVTFTAAAGTTYYFAVDGWGGYVGSVTFTLNFAGVPTDVAPTITQHPANRTVNINETATFTFGASGTPSPTYQWQRLPAGTGVWGNISNGSAFSGANTTTLSIAASYAMNGDQYRGVATNSAGSATSNAATLTVNAATVPVFNAHPVERTAEVDATVQFSAAATANPTPTYQWQYQASENSSWTNLVNSSNVSGATSSTLSLTASYAQNGYRYRCSALTPYYSATSNVALLTVLVPLPTITTQPAGQALLAGTPFSLSVGVTSVEAVTYQWRLNGNPIPNATSSSYSVSGLQPSDEGDYTVVATNSRGSVVSNVARVVIATPPVITGQPQPVEVYATTILFLSVRANSTAPLTYVWRRNGNPIPGATADTYSVSSAQTAQSGNYDVVVTTMAGSVTSETVAVLVKPVVPVRITQHPVSQSVFVGDTVTFTVAATGDPAPTYSWRSSRLDLPGIETQLNETSPTLVLYNLTASDSGTRYRCIVSNIDSVVASDSALLTVSEVGHTKLAAGRFHSVRLNFLSQLYSAGLNSSGQLGHGTTNNATSPQQITFGNPVAADISAFSFHTLVLTTAKELWATGSNATGQLGDGTLLNKTALTKIAGDVAGMAAGFFHTAYVKTDGTLWTVGGNDSGQLGDGTIVNRSTPAQIATGVVDVAAGIRQTLFIKTDGTLWGVGNLDGSDNYVTTPVQLATNVKAVAAGGYHTIFLKHDGTVWTLGYNATGQLGDGTFNSRLAPAQIATDARAVAAGYFHSAFIKSDHTAWTFGNNGLGQLGNGTNVTASTPGQLATQVATVAAGESFTLFTKLDGSLWATGLNSDGQFGNGTTTSVVVPTLIRAGAIFAPAIPLEVRASVDGSPAVTRITWQPSAAATSYEVWRGATNDSSLATLVASGLRWPLHLDASPSAASAFYWIKAVNAAGASALSAVATATPIPTNPPVITAPPTGATVDVGATVNFSVTATGDAPLSYQWRRNGDPLPSATAATYSIASAVVTDSGDYTVVVTNPAGSVTSDIAVLTVNKLAQTITFLAPADRGYTTTPFALTASASSSLPVTFTVESGPASINGDTLTLTGVGPVTVRAAQAGNATYAAAMSIDRSFTVSANLASWQLTRFTSAELLDAQISGPNADPDGDGLSNLLEYALGLEPRTATTSGLPEVAATASEWTYTYTRPSDRTDVTYAVEISTDLGAWTTDGVTHELVSTDAATGTQTWRARTPLTTGANVFFRLKATTANDQ